MRGLFIGRVELLTVALPDKWRLEIMPGMYLTNDADKVLEKVGDVECAAIGIVETEHLRLSRAILVGELDSFSEKFADLDAEQCLLIVFMWMAPVFRGFWMVKDNAARLGVCHLILEKDGTLTIGNNFPRDQFFLSTGGTEPVEFTKEEFDKALVFHDVTESHCFSLGSQAHVFLHAKGRSRIARSFAFLSQARNSGPALRIANLCSAFECLFSTDDAEITHKLSERVAFFLGESDADRRSLFSAMKTAYGIRSKLMHGDVLKQNDVDKLPETSQAFDSIYRQVVVKIFDETQTLAKFEASKEELSEYFVSLMFADPL